MNKKQYFEAPQAELIVVRFEKGFLYVSGDRNVTSTDGGVSGDDEYNDVYGDL